jgi:phosphate-selective porin
MEHMPRFFTPALAVAAALLLTVGVGRAPAEVPGPAEVAASGAEAARPGPTSVAEPPARISWKDGRTVLETSTFRLELSNRVQFRFTCVDPEGDGQGSFRIRRAKTRLTGWFWNRDLTYGLQLNWPADLPLEDAYLQDAYLQYAYLQYDLTGTKEIMVRAGQYKIPFGRQELTSSGALQFVDRTIASTDFAKGRDIGVMVTGHPLGGKLEYGLGIFNGAGLNQSRNDNDRYEYVGRVMFQPLGDVRYSESDFESEDSPLVAFAFDFDHNDACTDDGGNRGEAYGFDGAFKYLGFSATGEYFWRQNAARDEDGDVEFDDRGWYLQGGYLILPRHLEAALRYGQVDPDDGVDDDDQKELGIARSYYFHKHNLELQADWRRLENEATDAEDNEFRMQLQFTL